jgi:hypothetical protein
MNNKKKNEKKKKKKEMLEDLEIAKKLGKWSINPVNLKNGKSFYTVVFKTDECIEM